MEKLFVHLIELFIYKKQEYLWPEKSNYHIHVQNAEKR